MDSKINHLLHPIRMRILQSLLGGKQLTAQEILQKVNDVPQATLYRHLNKLVEADLLEVVQENKVRGTVEKVYAISNRLESMTAEEVKNASPQDNFNFFFSFLTNLLGDYDQYLQKENIDLAKDGVSFRQFSLFLSDEELMELLTDIRSLLYKAAENEPTTDRKLRTFSTIVLPKVTDK
ncbi:MAG: helix-turn-helix domain-containing protein [Bacillus sp. (in: Bacteria)]|nr:helix-turn-helix domain-containing protein [Bacillus sp. (in: firmicutes)]